MITCGTDIIRIPRIKESIERLGDNFLNRIFTTGEIEYCESKKASKFQSYAGRFAVKEAIYKAISPEKDNEISWKDAEVCKKENGKPFLKLHGDLEKIAQEKLVENIEISISHEDEYAIANVVVTYKEEN